MKHFTITESRFLDWYFFEGQDQEKVELRTELADSIINQMYTVGFGSYSVRELFDGCNQEAVRVYFTEEHLNDTENYDIEISDLEEDYKLTLI